jgi:hypothetical protein
MAGLRRSNLTVTAAARLCHMPAPVARRLKPGETQHITSLDRRAFSHYNVDKKDWSAEPGEFTILEGGSSDDTTPRGTFSLH